MTSPVNEQRARKSPIAIIWDFDGTLVDTRQRNLNVTRSIVEAVTGKRADEFQVLRSLQSYGTANARMTNWRELYVREFGLTEDETDAAGSLWTAYQLRDSTPSPIHAGIHYVLGQLRHVPHGIVSQNGRDNILAILRKIDLDGYFPSIIGYEEVGMRKQKPAPDGLLKCLEEITRNQPGDVFYIGDHETDAQCAVLANEELRSRNVNVRVISIGASYGSSDPTAHWSTQPDFFASMPHDIVSIITSFHHT